MLPLLPKLGSQLEEVRELSDDSMDAVLVNCLLLAFWFALRPNLSGLRSFVVSEEGLPPAPEYEAEPALVELLRRCHDEVEVGTEPNELPLISSWPCPLPALLPGILMADVGELGRDTMLVAGPPRPP